MQARRFRWLRRYDPPSLKNMVRDPPFNLKRGGSSRLLQDWWFSKLWMVSLFLEACCEKHHNRQADCMTTEMIKVNTRRTEHDICHLDPNLPRRAVVRDMYGTDPTQETYARSCRLYDSTRQQEIDYRSGTDRPERNVSFQWGSAVCPACESFG